MANFAIQILLLTCFWKNATALYIRSGPAEANDNKTSQLKKVSISSMAQTSALDNFLSSNTTGVKVVFFAGVEGSGHHLIEAIMRTGKIHYCPTGENGFRSWRCNKEWLREDFEAYTEYLRNLKQGCINVLPQQMSYPMCGVPDHKFRMTSAYPRLDWIHEAAEKAGVSLHVVFLNRPLDDCLASDCLGPHQKETCTDQKESLVSNAGFLAEHLRGFAPRDISCFRYGKPKSMEYAMSSVFGKEAHNLTSEVWKQHVSKETRDEVQNWAALSGELQPLQRTLERICRASASVTTKELSWRPLA